MSRPKYLDGENVVSMYSKLPLRGPSTLREPGRTKGPESREKGVQGHKDGLERINTSPSVRTVPGPTPSTGPHLESFTSFYQGCPSLTESLRTLETYHGPCRPVVRVQDGMFNRQVQKKTTHTRRVLYFQKIHLTK